jgi:amidohydrolase
VARRAAALKRLSLRIHAHPEVGYEEKQAAAWIVAQLRQWGFQVEAPVGGVATAFRATVGQGHPTLCLMAEYDALPGLGHACGHNLIATASLGAFAALADAVKRGDIPGTVQLVGTPAEELGGGKVRLVAAGLLKGVDAAFMAHPGSRTTPDPGCAGVLRYRVTFEGREAHAAGDPHKGLNALDGIRLLYAGIDAWRQQLPESSRIHGIVVEGGMAPNIIPGRAVTDFFLRSPDDAVLATMDRRFAGIARGAALMTGTKVKVAPTELPYKTCWPNAGLNETYVEAAEALGLHPVPVSVPDRASTDFGDVSHAVPGSHFSFSISRHDLAGHSPAFREAAATPFAQDRMLLAAQALARVGWRYLTDAALQARVRADYERRKRAGRAEAR